MINTYSCSDPTSGQQLDANDYIDSLLRRTADTLGEVETEVLDLKVRVQIAEDEIEDIQEEVIHSLELNCGSQMKIFLYFNLSLHN